MEAKDITRRLLILGRVQGVGFRWWVRASARRLGLSGWVRNRADGSVEALLRGAAAAVEEMTRLAHDGPIHADVERVVVIDEPGDGGILPGAPFEQLPTR